jgi:Sulfotransferase family
MTSEPTASATADTGGLGFVICGMEHTGTTLISDLFRQVPGIDAGFEVGVLIGMSPRDFPGLAPFARNILEGWGITEAELAVCCDTTSFAEFYSRLRAASRVLAHDTVTIFDKTPRYVSELGRVMGHVPVPVIVSYKDPRAIVFSDFKRAKPTDFNAWYNDFMPRKHRYVASCYNSWMAARDDARVCTVALEGLAMNARATMEQMFAHVGQRFDIGYALLDGLRYRNTRANFVSAEIAFEFRRVFTPEQQARIARDFSEFDAWFYA